MAPYQLFALFALAHLSETNQYLIIHFIYFLNTLFKVQRNVFFFPLSK